MCVYQCVNTMTPPEMRAIPQQFLAPGTCR